MKALTLFLVLVSGLLCVSLVPTPAAARTESADCSAMGGWTSLSSDSAPSPRRRHTAVWTGREMLVWGGAGSAERARDSALGDGARYDPATDTWVPISSGGAPRARDLFTAVWTGSEMIIWGGWNGSPLNDGGRYDPATDTWSPVSSAGAPSPRATHAAIWTGSEMIIWGGGGEEQNAGGRYNPSTDTWAPMSLEGSYTVHGRPTMVWTGEEIIIWGGGAQPYTTARGEPGMGRRYNPQTDIWTPVSTVGAPSARYEHSAVWTGDEMLIWGGAGAYAGLDMRNDGAAYNPQTDTWRPLNPAGAPSNRHQHVAVWTGREMIVWGGRIEAGRATVRGLDDGARYDPAADRWIPLPPAGLTGRSYHTGVWTENELVIWGGTSEPTSLGYRAVRQDGTRYSPPC